MPAMKAIFSRISAPPNTSVTSRVQSSPEPDSSRLSAGIEQYGARMNWPRPWSYHQKAMAVPISTNSRAMPIRLRSSLRCPTSDIVAASSRGGRLRRRTRDLLASAVLTAW